CAINETKYLYHCSLVLNAHPLVKFIFSFFFFNDTATTEIYTLSLQRRSSDLAQTLEHCLAHADVPNFVLDHPGGGRQDGWRRAEPCQIAGDHGCRDDGVAFVLTERRPAGDQARNRRGGQ